MRPLLGLSILALLVTGCAGAGSLTSTGTSGPPMPTASAPATLATSATPMQLASTAPSPAGSASPVASPGAPPAPADVTWSQTPALGFGAGTSTMTVSWNEASMAGTTIRVYGVTACLSPPGVDNAPCVAASASVPDDKLTLVATAPAGEGRVSWTWPSWGDIGGALAVHGDDSYYAFVVDASDAAGRSAMTVAVTARSCLGCTY